MLRVGFLSEDQYKSFSYSTISLSNAVVPLVGQSFGGTRDYSFQYKQMYGIRYEGSVTASSAITILRPKGVYFVGYVGAFDACLAHDPQYISQRPALFYHESDILT